MNIPNGPTGYYRAVGIGGRPVENELAEDKGEYNSRYTQNAGSYYEKMYSAMLFRSADTSSVPAGRISLMVGIGL